MKNLPCSRRGLDPRTPDRTSVELYEQLITAQQLRVCHVSTRGRVKLSQSSAQGSDSLTVSQLESVPDLAQQFAQGRAAFLGETPEGELCVGLFVPDSQAQGEEWKRLQFVGAYLNDAEVMMTMESAALANWHSQMKYCSRCGSSLRTRSLGWMKECVKCGHLVYPRTDPAVIMAIHDQQDRLLLAHNAHWPERLASLIAGYIDAAETPESAVLREISEEVGFHGIDASAIKYIASQPWPFPRSLMLVYRVQLGVEGEAADQLIQVDNNEIMWANFYSKADLRKAIETRDLMMPASSSVARAYIAQWMGEMMPAEVWE
ncbi:NAD(+) diphosphatase [Boudabousia marimammalium]|uniref:NAD(+) diphosphatase n=1 Tax=Boudabousia marimammalium TaxID=156892 RepID=A0A1Q5PM01_9ACTO|nr:NAD(+) diphosphatase [Boudabousia marimammalium]OKL48070.1 hypothetical protein BM477_06280 [Boudabousia marimammalium]